MTSKTIPELYELGEEHIRNFESLACKKLAEKNNVIISSGGGVVKRKENIDVLKEESFIIFIDRPLEDLLGDIDISKRPLLKDGREKLVRLYEERYELYRTSADEIIKNDKELKDTINIVKKAIISNLNID